MRGSALAPSEHLLRAALQDAERAAVLGWYTPSASHPDRVAAWHGYHKAVRRVAGLLAARPWKEGVDFRLASRYAVYRVGTRTARLHLAGDPDLMIREYGILAELLRPLVPSVPGEHLEELVCDISRSLRSPRR